ncbi:hypothetical protein [Novosphingobium sp.]|uniref:hypothetical protein n=1 Tax=Novosphingobium sp. TaxID=1874826 RepID=UPI0031DFEBEB
MLQNFMNHGIVFWIIAFAGYYAIIGALAWIIEKFAFRSLPPLQRASRTIGLSFAIAVLCEVKFSPSWYSLLIIPAAALSFYRYHRNLEQSWLQEFAEPL